MPQTADRPAAVLVPVFRRGGGELRLVLVRRGEGGIHGGQLAFPGGKREPGDADLRATALRETGEEIGLAPGSVEVLAPLPAIATRTTGFRIQPFLARIEPPDAWHPRAGEIAEVLEVEVRALLGPEAYGEEVMEFSTWPAPRSVPFYRVGDLRVWGATYRILHPLLPRLAAGEWRL